MSGTLKYYQKLLHMLADDVHGLAKRLLNSDVNT